METDLRIYLPRDPRQLVPAFPASMDTIKQLEIAAQLNAVVEKVTSAYHSAVKARRTKFTHFDTELLKELRSLVDEMKLYFPEWPDQFAAIEANVDTILRPGEWIIPFPRSRHHGSTPD